MAGAQKRRASDQGDRAEALAVSFLDDQGYRVLQRNVRCSSGEIDVIAFEGETLCFVEVRSVSNERYGGPLETIDRRKQQKIATAAREFLASSSLPWSQIRFDAVGVVMSDPPRIELVRHAFEV